MEPLSFWRFPRVGMAAAAGLSSVEPSWIRFHSQLGNHAAVVIWLEAPLTKSRLLAAEISARTLGALSHMGWMELVSTCLSHVPGVPWMFRGV